MNHYNLSYTFELVENFQFTILLVSTLSPHPRRDLQLIIFTVNYCNVYSNIIKLFQNIHTFIQILQTCIFFMERYRRGLYPAVGANRLLVIMLITLF